MAQCLPKYKGGPWPKMPPKYKGDWSDAPKYKGDHDPMPLNTKGTVAKYPLNIKGEPWPNAHL